MHIRHSDWNRIVIRSSPERLRVFLNGHLFYEEADPSPTSPWLAFTAVTLPVAWLREARRGNQAAAMAKLKGIREGMRIPLPPPPRLTPPA